MKKVIWLLMFLLFFVIVAGCQKNVKLEPPETPVSGTILVTGMVYYISLEGGFWAVISDDGDYYNPISFPDGLKKEYLKVQFRGKIREDIISTKMWGIPVEIIEYEILK